MINDFHDLRRAFTKRLLGVDVDNAFDDYETLIEYGTERFLWHLEDEYDFKFGQELPSLHVDPIEFLQDHVLDFI